MELNALGMKCPMPIIKISRAIKEIKIGDTLTVLADDGPFGADLQTWCEKTGQELVSFNNRDPKRMVAVIRRLKE